MRVAILFAACLMSGGIAPASALAADVVIYRCTDSFGALTVQNDTPCPKGSKQQKQVIQPPPPMPAYRPVEPPPRPAPIPAPAPAVPAEPEPSKIADSDRLPPPVLYQCNTYDHDSYLSENATPQPRCVTLQTTNLQGASSNLGSACQMVTDQCQRVADGAACTAWKQRLRETEAAWKFARPADADANRADYERVQAIVRDSTCGK
jgi:hypothetical protein